jgi:hypothetical protein
MRWWRPSYFPRINGGGLGGDLKAAGGAVGADGYADAFEQAGADQAGGWRVEVEECVGGLAAADATLVGSACRPLTWAATRQAAARSPTRVRTDRGSGRAASHAHR